MEKEMHLRVHLLPKLGHLKLTLITNERVTELFGLLRCAGYQKKGTAVRSQQPKAVQKRKERARAGGRKDRGKPRKGLGEKSIKNLRTTLHTILVYAMKWGYLDRLPELPQVRVPEASFDWYQPKEAARLIEAAANEGERAVLMFPLHTGARMGGSEKSGSASDQVARAEALLRFDSGLRRNAALHPPCSAWTLVGEDDGALCASRRRAERGVFAFALRRGVSDPVDERTRLQWAPGGPESTATT